MNAALERRWPAVREQAPRWPRDVCAGFLTIESNLQLVAAALPVLGADRRLRFI